MGIFQEVFIIFPKNKNKQKKEQTNSNTYIITFHSILKAKFIIKRTNNKCRIKCRYIFRSSLWKLLALKLFLS